MRVIDVRDFCVPSDENDYDELVAFADTMASIPQFDAVPIDVLDKIRAEIKEHADRLKDSLYGDGMRHCVDIIDKYKARSQTGTEGSDRGNDTDSK